MGVTTTKTNKPLNPRGNDQSPKGYNRAALYSGKALDFDGVNDNLTATGSNALSFSQITMSAYFKFDNLGATQVIFAKRKNVAGYWSAAFVMSSSGELDFRTTTGTTEQKVVYSDFVTGEYYHAVGVKDDSNNYLYINGQLVDTTASGAIDNTTTYDFVLGNNATGQYYYNGQISNAKVFDVALTAAQVADLYNNPEKIVPTGVADSALKLWLPMMEGAGTTAYDGSGNGNHGTINGATYVNGIGAPVAQTAVIDWNKGQNLYAYSEQFDESSYWSYTQIHAVDSTDNEAPDGSLTADKLIANTNTAFHHIGKGVTGITIGVSYRLSVWAKAGGHDYILINTAGGSASGNAGPIVNLTNGSIAGSLNGEDYDATITDAGNGWYKIEYDFTSNGTTISIDYNQLPSASITAYAGDNTKGVYLWGASLRPASSGSTYVRTGATAQTSDVLLPQGLTTGRDITGVNLFENVRKQGALNLDGNSWAEVHDNASVDLTTEATFEAWVNNKTGELSTNNRYMPIFDKATASNGTNGFTLRLYSSYSANGGYFAVGGTFVTFDFTDGSYQHIVVTLEANSQKIYINGALQDTYTNAWTITQNGSDLLIGYAPSDGEQWLNGSIAQPRIYNRALSAEEVERNYTAGKYIYTND
jgi:hypothetical protein